MRSLFAHSPPQTECLRPSGRRSTKPAFAASMPPNRHTAFPTPVEPGNCPNGEHSFLTLSLRSLACPAVRPDPLSEGQITVPTKPTNAPTCPSAALAASGDRIRRDPDFTSVQPGSHVWNGGHADRHRRTNFEGRTAQLLSAFSPAVAQVEISISDSCPEVLT